MEASAPRLTSRQHETLQLVAAGKSTTQIADAMCVTYDSAKKYVINLLGLFQVHNRLNLVLKAQRLGLVEFPGADRRSVV